MITSMMTTSRSLIVGSICSASTLTCSSSARIVEVVMIQVTEVSIILPYEG